MWYQNIRIASFSFVTIHACDGQTDGQNYDSQDRPGICSRSKNGGLDQYGVERIDRLILPQPEKCRNERVKQIAN